MNARIAAGLRERLAMDKFFGVKFVRLTAATRQRLLAYFSVAAPDNGGVVNSAPAKSELSPVKNPESHVVIVAEKNQEFVMREPLLTGAESRIAPSRELYRQLGGCRNCDLCHQRRQVVFGEGNLDARLLLISEAPGKEEDFSGRFFGDAAGELLAAMLEKGLKIPRDEVFITTLVKCRPQGNKSPKPVEIAACENFLWQQIEMIGPQLIVTLGERAAQVLTGEKKGITELRGRDFKWRNVTVSPIYHPAFIAQQRRQLGRDNQYDRDTWNDLKKIAARLRE